MLLQPHLAGAGDLERPLHRPRLVTGLLVLERRDGVGDDAATGLEVGDTVFEECCAERYAGVEAAVDAVVARGARVGSAARALELVDDLHGPDLRRAGDGPRGEGRRESVEGRQVFSQVSLDSRDDVHDVRVALYLHK